MLSGPQTDAQLTSANDKDANVSRNLEDAGGEVLPRGRVPRGVLADVGWTDDP